jgi:acyl-CoA synthetase (AMP-forming)/AMP-acid ligase II
MRIDDPQIPPERMREFERAGHWISTTSNEELDRVAAGTPARIALVDVRGRLTYAEYHRRVRRLAAHFIALGLTAEDVIAVQLPNWSEFAIAVNAAMMAGVPFCQYHSDFRAREVEFILGFTSASLVIAPREFRRFDYPAMIREMRPRLPALKHEMYVGDAVPPAVFDLRRFLDVDAPLEVPEAELQRRRPHGNTLMRTAFTSGTTGDPKAVLHLHNTTNCACRFLNQGQAIGPDSVLLIFLPAGLNWGLFNVQQAIYAGCTAVLQDVFKPEQALALIQQEKVTHFCCAPAHLVSMLNVKDFDAYDLRSLQVMMTGGASCPIEVIREVRQRMPGHLLEMYGMLEVGSQAHTRLDEDPEAVCGLVGRSLPAMRNRVVDEHGVECPPGAVGEILTYGPSVTIGYYNNPDANRRSFTRDGWFHTGDLGVFDDRGYLRIVGRTKEMIIRGGANIYPREIEEVLYQHPKVMDAAVVGLPDHRLGERTCACIVPKAGQTITLAEVTDFLRPRIATYKLPEFVEVMTELPRTPTGKIQKGPLRDLVVGRRAARGQTGAY